LGWREWAATIVKFSIRDTQIEWPPKDWKEMNPDKKLHAWEFVSTQLEFLLTWSFQTMETTHYQYFFCLLSGIVSIDRLVSNGSGVAAGYCWRSVDWKHRRFCLVLDCN
jgi:hypothetical protein